MDCNDQKIERFEYLIIGGGVAGLSVANRLVDLGVSPAIVDAAEYPAHKVCGEFFSFDCHHILKEWNVLPSSIINSVRYHVGDHSYSFPLPIPARGMSRYFFDTLLYERAVKKGALLYSKMLVTKISYNPLDLFNYLVHLDNGKILLAKKLFIGTGRVMSLLLGKKSPKMKYMGFKAHFEGITQPNNLEMFLLPQSYLGISPIGEGKVNVACLATRDVVLKAGSPEDYLKAIYQTSSGANIKKILTHGKNSFSHWMVAEVPEFSWAPKPLYDYHNLYLIGDAAASIAPMSGEGLGMAVTSGVMAADSAIKNHDALYRQQWVERYGKRLRWAGGLHWLMLHPFLGEKLLRCCIKFPALFNMLYFTTRER
jgi:flavin-dependent dehydrogenase